MSTLGKVLVVLVTLALVGWILLASMVAERNANWNKALIRVKGEAATMEPELPPMQAAIDRTIAEASRLQVDLDRSRRNFRAEFAMAQRQESDTKEALSRHTFQRTLAEEEVQKARARAEVRAQEKADLERRIAQEQARVRDLVAENTRLRDELEGLQKSFLEVTRENRSYLERQKKANTAPPRARLGSLVR